MATHGKIGGRGGVAAWRNLETPGDVRRFLAWVVHSLRNNKIEKSEAAVFSQLGLALLKACSESEFEERLLTLEKKVAERDGLQSSSTTTTH